jgi:predicted enzyme related to lactoylglutathione lyase
MPNTNTGDFVWYELMTTDPSAASAFYTHVIGWNTQPFREGKEPYTLWTGSQGPLGGLMQLPEEARKRGVKPHWMANVHVADVDATVARTRELGGSVHFGPIDIPKVGRMAVIADPQGAAISVIQMSEPMARHDNTKHGEFAWGELLTSDHEAGFRFYNELFGWQNIREHDMGAMGKYLLFGQGGKEFGGMFTKTKDMPMPPSWLYYVFVDDLDAAIARAKDKGGQLLNGPMDVPGGGRIAQMMDPQGAAFALLGQGTKA